MDHPIVQTIAATVTVTSIIGWLPLVFGAVTAIYYLILIIEKFTGRKFSQFFKKGCDKCLK